MPTPDKDTIYIDIDDEITAVIDKVRASDGKITALVLPKRASVFQSIVNMKLLKRAADDAKKHLVLITAEAGLLPLAGAAGIHVAKTLNSKPEIPVSPLQNDDAEDTIDEDGETPVELDDEVDGETPVGELAGTAAASAPLIDKNGVETIELDDDVAPEDAADDATDEPKKQPKKDKRLAVPNFEKFRLLLIIGGIALIGLIVFLVFAFTVLPKATISIKTDATNIDASLPLNLSTTTTTLRRSNNTLPAKMVQQQKTYSQQASASGQKNNGSKAQGSLTLTDCSDDDVTIPAGTGFSNGGNTYISQQSVTVPASSFRHGSCQSDEKVPVSVVAQNAGTAYNVSSGAGFTVSGVGNITAKANGPVGGGTDNVVQIVTQSDINNAKNKISTTDDSVKQALQNQLKSSNYYAIVTTYNAGEPSATNSVEAGAAAGSVTVTETVTYTMFGVKQDDLETVVNDAIGKKIDTSKQNILDNGLAKASFNVGATSPTGAQLTMAVTATAGPELDVDAIKQQAAGKKPGDVQSLLKANPDVTDVDVKLSPFWVSSVPKKVNKITVNIAKPSVSSSSNSSNDSN